MKSSISTRNHHKFFWIMYAHFTTELRALFLPEITYLLRKSHQWFSEQLLVFFGRHWGRNLCSENTFLHNMFPLRGYTSAKWSRQRYNYGSNNKKNNCNVTQQSPHLTSDCFGLWAITYPRKPRTIAITMVLQWCWSESKAYQASALHRGILCTHESSNVVVHMFQHV